MSSSGLNLAGKKERLENLDLANAEIEKLRKLGEKLTGELQVKNIHNLKKNSKKILKFLFF